MTLDASLPGDVAGMLALMHGVWEDHLEAFAPDGSPMADDPYGGSPGPFPYDNLVYCEFDASSGRYRQTNVTFRGRALKERSFEAVVGDDGWLRFAGLGPDDPGHVGVAGGPGILWFVPDTTTHPGLARFSEPDQVRLVSADERTRLTTLYRGGRLVRTMCVVGRRVGADPSTRLASDPRGADGPVHVPRVASQVWVSDTGTNG